MDIIKPLPILNAEEQRVLGALMEKNKTTPDYYPMTLNGLTAACNQKTSRKPVVQYDEETIVLTLNSLKKIGLISTATGGSSRAVKYKHNFAIIFPLLPEEVALICLLLLRGPQTPGELHTNSGRIYEFDSLEQVNEVLEKLALEKYVLQMPKRAGQKEVRFIHLLSETSQYDEESFNDEPARKSTSDLESRLFKVEQELAEMKEAFDKLMKELLG